jgi:ribosomal-protein-alanine N-acetyltransferase
MKINERCLPENYSTYFYRDLFQRYPEAFLVAEVNGQIQGYIMCRIERGFSKFGGLMPTKLSHIVSIAVMQGYRRHGVASSLISEDMKRSADIYGTSEMYLEVRITNDAAILLYEKLGFKKVKRNYGYYMDGEDAWVMAITLDKMER